VAFSFLGGRFAVVAGVIESSRDRTGASS